MLSFSFIFEHDFLASTVYPDSTEIDSPVSSPAEIGIEIHRTRLCQKRTSARERDSRYRNHLIDPLLQSSRVTRASRSPSCQDRILPDVITLSARSIRSDKAIVECSGPLRSMTSIVGVYILIYRQPPHNEIRK